MQDSKDPLKNIQMLTNFPIKAEIFSQEIVWCMFFCVLIKNFLLKNPHIYKDRCPSEPEVHGHIIPVSQLPSSGMSLTNISVTKVTTFCLLPTWGYMTVSFPMQNLHLAHHRLPEQLFCRYIITSWGWTALNTQVPSFKVWSQKQFNLWHFCCYLASSFDYLDVVTANKCLPISVLNWDVHEQ